MAIVKLHPSIAEKVGRQAAEQVVRITMVAYIAEVKRLMREHKTGRIYIRPGGRVHQASAPGEAPAIDFETLIDAIGFSMHEIGQGMEGIAGVLANAPNGPNGANPQDYALYLEFGTSKMAPRPVWRPAIAPAIQFANARLKDSQVKVQVAFEFQSGLGEVETVQAGEFAE